MATRRILPQPSGLGETCDLAGDEERLQRWLQILFRAQPPITKDRGFRGQRDDPWKMVRPVSQKPVSSMCERGIDAGKAIFCDPV
jgi:hypothetical protein